MASTSDIRNGVVLSIDGQLWNVIEFQHVKPGKGGAFVRTKLKNVVSGKTVTDWFSSMKFAASPTTVPRTSCSRTSR